MFAGDFALSYDEGDETMNIYGEFVAIRAEKEPALARRRFRLAGQCLSFSLERGFRQCVGFSVYEGGQTEWRWVIR